MIRIISISLLLLGTSFAKGDEDSPTVLLKLNGSPADPAQIDYAQLPVLGGTHRVINATDQTLKFQLHNYLAYHDGKFFCMWSQGPPVEDEPSQHIRYATSADGLNWNPAKVLVGPPAEGYAYIARSFWQRDGKLLALAAHFKGKGAFGVNKELQLLAFSWNGKSETWEPAGKLFDNAINNFAPQQLPTGEWMMTRRDSRFNVTVLIGGHSRIDDWKSFPVVERQAVKGFSPDEPIWWSLPDGELVALFRDNGGSGRLFHARSTDNGRTWTLPAKTNFPNATSKIFSLQLSNGKRVLISNANPAIGRRELHLSVSADGEIFERVWRLDIPSPRPGTLQYPHAVERDGKLFISFSRNKNQSELFVVPVKSIDPS